MGDSVHTVMLDSALLSIVCDGGAKERRKKLNDMPMDGSSTLAFGVSVPPPSDLYARTALDAISSVFRIPMSQPSLVHGVA